MDRMHLTLHCVLVPQVNDFVCLSDRAYSHHQILVMEKTILGKLEWTLTVPTPYVFLVRFVKASIPDQQVRSKILPAAVFLMLGFILPFFFLFFFFFQKLELLKIVFDFVL